MGALLLCGCATTQLTERFVITGDAQTLQQAAQAASSRLGWTTAAADSDSFQIIGYPRQSRTSPGVLKVRSENDVLSIEGGQESGLPFLPETARMLASATAQQLGQKTGGAAVAERSTALTVGLDVLLPAAGALYGLHGDPYFDSSAVIGLRSFWWEFFGRLGCDLAAAGLLAEFALLQNPDGSRTMPLWTIASPIIVLVVMRVSSVINVLIEVPYRNAYARSGLHAPEDP